MWKTIVLVACVSIFAHAQFQYSFPSRGQVNYQTPRQNNDQPGQYQQSQYQQGQYQQGEYQQGQTQRQFQQGQTQQRQYQQEQTQQNQYQNQPIEPVRVRDGSCKELNERYPVSGSCDKYIECVNGTAEEKLCPDGLRFNPNAKFTSYPCAYPNEVSCLERSALQPAQPTDACPNQFGFFKLGDARNCSGFRNCVGGVGFDFVCPDGLAFSSESYRCEWPDEVADCDAEAFLGFRCPEIPVSRELGPPAGYRFYRSDANCQKYFLCINGKPRGLSCGTNSAFDDLTSSCVSADEVDACPPEVREIAARTREEEQQRLAKEIQFNARPKQLKKRL